MEPVGILLAAGSASRFGAPKLLQSLTDGTPVGLASARGLIKPLSRVIAVIRPGDYLLREAFTGMGLEVVVNPQAEKGMGSSLAAGVEAAFDASGWVIALADMPWVEATTITTLAKRLKEGASLVAPVYQGRRGNPVGFSAQWCRDLTGLSGDHGARDLLVRHADELELFDTEDAGVVADVDYQADLHC